ncbi:MAG: sigma-70 family RNA polymerase sigma factor, partial [Streptosporangiaceae bacterium]
MEDSDWLAARFEEHRDRLQAVAYRMLGSRGEAEDAVQEAWLRLSRSGDGVTNLGGWLTTVVSRICLDILRGRREDLAGTLLTERADDAAGPEDEALLADSVGLALQIVLDRLAPAERVAFVLHDMFDLPFGQIATIMDRSPNATRLLASRARRHIRGKTPDPDLQHQRAVVGAFFAAARDGDFDALLALLDPGATVRAGMPGEPRGALAVARRALEFARFAQFAQPAIVNGMAGTIMTPPGQPYWVMTFTVTPAGKMSTIEIISNPTRLRELDLAITSPDRTPIDDPSMALFGHRWAIDGG